MRSLSLRIVLLRCLTNPRLLEVILRLGEIFLALCQFSVELVDVLLPLLRLLEGFENFLHCVWHILLKCGNTFEENRRLSTIESRIFTAKAVFVLDKILLIVRILLSQLLGCQFAQFLELHHLVIIAVVDHFSV